MVGVGEQQLMAVLDQSFNVLLEPRSETERTVVVRVHYCEVQTIELTCLTAFGN